jgi:plastocyanin
MRRMRLRTALILAALAAAVALAVPVLGLGEGETGRTSLKTYTLRFGPVSLGGYEVRQDTSATVSPRVNGYIVGMRSYVADARGHPIPIRRLMLHHVLFKDLGARDGDRHDGACPSIPRERFYGTGEEHQTLALPDGYGVPIRRSDRWQISWMLMNHRQQGDRGYIYYRVTVDTKRKLTPVKAFWLDVTGCRGPVQYSVRGGGVPGSTSSKRTTWTVPANGRLVAGGAHEHGGVKDVRLFQTRCGNRQLPDSRPLYGLRSDPVYHVLPVLHEPGPINTSWFTTRKGIPLRKGERIVVSGDYDGQYPHTRVMAIDHVYMAFGGRMPAGCQPPPDDLKNRNSAVPGRPTPPRVVVPLTAIGPDGRAHTIARPPGPDVSVGPSATIVVGGFRFSQRNLTIPEGGTLTWRFPDRGIQHDVTVANGPDGFATPYSSKGERFSHRFVRPGYYQIFCSLHPVLMQETVKVVGRGQVRRRSLSSGSSASSVHW